MHQTFGYVNNQHHDVDNLCATNNGLDQRRVARAVDQRKLHLANPCGHHTMPEMRLGCQWIEKTYLVF